MLIGAALAIFVTLNFLIVDGKLYLFWAALAIGLTFFGLERLRAPVTEGGEASPAPAASGRRYLDGDAVEDGVARRDVD